MSDQAQTINEAVNLQEELVDHLGHPESAAVLYRERISVDFLARDEKDARALLPFVMGYIDKHGQPPTPQQIIHDFGGGHFNEPTTPVEWLIEKLRQRYERNQAKDIVTHLATMVTADPHAAIREGLSRLSDVSRKTASQSRSLDLASWNEAVKDYHRRVVDGTYQGFSFGFPEMDEVTGGLKRSQMGFLLGRPKTGKSWFGLTMGVVNMMAGARVLLPSMELREDEMYGRFQCMVAGISYSHYSRGRLTVDEQHRLAEVGEWLTDCPGDIKIYHPHADERGVRDITGVADDWGADLVIADQFSFLTSTLPESVADHQRRSKTVYDIKDACEKRPWMVMAQLNREAASLEEMADAAQASLTDAIGQAADIILGIHRNKEMFKNNLAQYGVMVARSAQSIRGLVSYQLTKDTKLKWVETEAVW